ncbi:hypothetical protein LTR94_023882 [Friedmanniomyces endolithicus]|nr:hypothetical protein LTR94_023882 [Friedmanniomyces endolithicus]
MTAQGRDVSRLAVETLNGAMLPDQPPGDRRLVVIDAKTGGQTVAYEGPIRDVAPSPDGRTLAVLMQGEPAALREDERALQNVILRRSRLALIDVATGTVSHTPADLDVAPHLLQWSGQTDQVLIWGRKDGQSWDQGGVIAISRGGALQQVPSGQLRPSAPGRTVDEVNPPKAEWLGRVPLLRAWAPGATYAQWWRLGGDEPMALGHSASAPLDRPAALSGDDLYYSAGGRLWRADADGATTPVAAAPSGSATGAAIPRRSPLRAQLNTTPRQDWVAISSDDDLSAVRLEDGSLLWRGQTNCVGAQRVLASHEAGAVRLCLSSGVETLTAIDGDGERTLDELNSGLRKAVLSRPTPVYYEGAGGAQATSYLYLPPGATPSQVKGVIVHIYPGGVYDGSYVDGASLRAAISPQLLTMGGYAVSAVDGRPSVDRFEIMSAEVDQALQGLFKHFPDLPQEKLAIVGHSFGGYAALGVAARSDRFKAVVAWAAPTELISAWGELSPLSRLWPEDMLSFNRAIGYVETGQARLGAPPWQALEAYGTASPALQPERLKAPVLLLTADGDFVSRSQASQMFSALHRVGRPARLIEYRGEEHDNSSPANLHDAYAEIFLWIERAFAESVSEAAVASGP